MGDAREKGAVDIRNMAEVRWTLDGNHSAVMDTRLDATDTMLFAICICRAVRPGLLVRRA